jgi:hypothetical protein
MYWPILPFRLSDVAIYHGIDIPAEPGTIHKNRASIRFMQVKCNRESKKKMGSFWQ